MNVSANPSTLKTRILLNTSYPSFVGPLLIRIGIWQESLSPMFFYVFVGGMRIKKAIIPVAGLGTRFLPATKSVPKELLPIVDRPLLLWNVDEIIASGIEDIILIMGRGKTAIEDLFDTSYELEDLLYKSGKFQQLEDLKRIRNSCNIISVRQKQALGLGHAVYTARPVVGNEPFALLLGDELMLQEPAPATKILAEIYEAHDVSSVAVIEVSEEEVDKYGIIEVDHTKDGIIRVKSVIEKPKASEAPSHLALSGRYVFSSDIFAALENIKPGKNGEIQLSDAMSTIAQTQGLVATVLKNERFDAGDKLGFLKANVMMGMKHPEVGADFKKFIKELCQGEF